MLDNYQLTHKHKKPVVAEKIHKWHSSCPSTIRFHSLLLLQLMLTDELIHGYQHHPTTSSDTIPEGGSRKGCELGDGRGALGDGVLSGPPGEDQADGGLDAAVRDWWAVVATHGELCEDVARIGHRYQTMLNVRVCLI